MNANQIAKCNEKNYKEGCGEIVHRVVVGVDVLIATTRMARNNGGFSVSNHLRTTWTFKGKRVSKDKADELLATA